MRAGVLAARAWTQELLQAQAQVQVQAQVRQVLQAWLSSPLGPAELSAPLLLPGPRVSAPACEPVAAIPIELQLLQVLYCFSALTLCTSLTLHPR